MGLVKWILSSFLNGAEKKNKVDVSLNTQGLRRTIRNRSDQELTFLFYPAKKANAPLLINLPDAWYDSKSLHNNESFCNLIRSQGEVNVASLSYRFAPAATYPGATEDVIDQMISIIQDNRLDFNRKAVFLIGHGVGANLSASCLLQKTTVLPISFKGLILDVPYLDARITTKRVAAGGRKLPKMFLAATKLYFSKKESPLEVCASPVLITKEEALKLPETWIVTAGFDPLETDGVLFNESLTKAGVPVTYRPVPGAYHGFLERIAKGFDPTWGKLSKETQTEQRKLAEPIIAEMIRFMSSRSVETKKNK